MVTMSLGERGEKSMPRASMGGMRKLPTSWLSRTPAARPRPRRPKRRLVQKDKRKRTRNTATMMIKPVMVRL